MNIPLELPVVGLCLLVQGFLAGIEIGVISINRHRLQHLVRSGSERARIIEGYLRDTPRLLGTTLVGTCITLVTISTLTASVAERNFGQTGQTVCAVASSLVLLIFGEYLPKIWFNRRPVERCLPFAHVLRLAERALGPLVRLTLLLTRWASPRQAENQSLFVTREHIQILVQDSAAGGEISAFERLMINRVLDLQLKTAADLMTPLSQVSHAHGASTLQACSELAMHSGHLRLPVLDADDGTCLGILHLLDSLARAEDPATVTASSCMTPPFFIAPGVHADDLLPLMRRQRQPMAVVRDASGKVLGLVTQENIVAFLMGALPAKT